MLDMHAVPVDVLHRLVKHVLVGDDAALQVPQAARGANRDVEGAMTCRAVGVCRFDELGRALVDLDPCALGLVDARHVGACTRAREKPLVFHAVLVCAHQPICAGIFLAICAYAHPRVECVERYVRPSVSRVQLVAVHDFPSRVFVFCRLHHIPSSAICLIPTI